MSIRIGIGFKGSHDLFVIMELFYELFFFMDGAVKNNLLINQMITKFTRLFFDKAGDCRKET